MRDQQKPRRFVFVDESKANDYLLASTVIDLLDLTAARRTVRGFVLPGQNRLHMTKESDSRRRLILASIARLPLATTVYRAPKDGRNEVERRARCLDALIDDLAIGSPAALCLERDETLTARDRQRFVEASRRTGQTLNHQHASTAEEPLLAIPDAVAWAWARGGEWRRRCPTANERRPSV